MNKTFKTSIKRLPAMPRSKRRRASGAGASGGGTIVYNGVAGHQHSNLPQLEQIDTDADGYLWLRRTVEDGSAVETSVEKVRAGYADMAHDLDADSPVRGQFLSRITEDNALERITFDKGIRVGSIVINEVNGLLHVSKGLYSDGGITALGINQEGTGGSGTGGGGYPLMTDWSDNVSTGDKALDAYLAKGLKGDVSALTTRVSTVEGRLSSYITTEIAYNSFVPSSAVSSLLAPYVMTTEMNAALAGYLPLTGGVMTGALGHRMRWNTSNFETALYWRSAATDEAPTGVTLATVSYHNTSQRVLINPCSDEATDLHNDTAGKYSLRIGKNELTYNSYPILRTDNYAGTLDSRYVKKAGDTMSGMLTAPIVTVTSKLVVGGIELTVDNGLLHIKGGMYADGGITALGVNQEGTGGSGTGGGGYPLLLSWNESAASGEKALDAYLAKGLKSRVDAIESNYVAGAALANYVTGAQLTGALSGYVTTAALNGTLSGFVTNSALTSALSGYLPLTGGTLYSSSTNSPLSVRQGVGSGTARVSFEKSDGTLLGGLGVSVGGAPMFVNDSGTAYNLLHDGNYSGTLDSRYVKKAGDTMSGMLTAPIVTVTSKLVLGGAELTWDSANGLLRVSKGLYSEGGITALGVNPGADAPGTGGYPLLSDWTETVRSGEKALDAYLAKGLKNRVDAIESNYVAGTALANYVPTAAFTQTLSQYAKTSDLSGYLPVTGGTIYSTATNAPLAIRQGVGSGTARVSFEKSDGTNVGALGVSVGGAPMFVNASGTAYKLLHDGDYTTTLDGRYLKLTGGTLSGRLDIAAGLMFTSTPDSANNDTHVRFNNGTVDTGRIGGNNAGDVAVYAKNKIYLRWGCGNNITDMTKGLILSDDGSTLSGGLNVSGNVGVGTDSPTERLHVAGNVYATGDVKSATALKVGNNLAVSVVSGAVRWYTSGATTEFHTGSVDFKGLASGVWAPVGCGNLTVNGTASVTGTATVGNLTSNGWVTALDTSQTSDIRRKRVLGPAELSVEDVAGAPAVRFEWKMPGGETTGAVAGEHVGSVAQYWQQVLPQTVREADGSLTLNYGVTALLASIATARRTVENTDRIAAVESEIERLTNELKELKGQ